ncbi:serine/threonine-protein kinase tousled-like 1 [Platysternon megacephalum]|uniref:Serine/threonine-protein kinase tousled-like 1 n=1 Tax=Platysternon megacephalum TaxID=55544 RepID=A0A4D9DL90_9SAUR|nr:serine/threonine-protein kinase tousled-like 1 [Platysternon megacephalum]
MDPTIIPRASRTMSDGDKNPASTPTPLADVQGDGRWLALHHRFIADSKDKEPEVVFIGDALVQLLQQFEVSPPLALALPRQAGAAIRGPRPPQGPRR